ncbi:hypothetical protein Vspart_03806 [Vibrio spartinae]|uniref:Uncharacterized protein n=1 Tax=Vibrio spartinae TaxID=1918945 RepID=A0ABX6R4E1_9VIBR|nr:hypothetical protein Vspart_03806 [Vibrio spartinae]
MNIILKIVLSFVAYFIFITFHDLFRHFYVNYFEVMSKGIELGFVNFIAIYIMIPYFVVLSLVKNGYKLLAYISVNVYIFYTWIGYHPYRVILIFLCLTVASFFIYFIENKYFKNKVR